MSDQNPDVFHVAVQVALSTDDSRWQDLKDQVEALAVELAWQRHFTGEDASARIWRSACWTMTINGRDHLDRLRERLGAIQQDFGDQCGIGLLLGIEIEIIMPKTEETEETEQTEETAGE